MEQVTPRRRFREQIEEITERLKQDRIAFYARNGREQRPITIPLWSPIAFYAGLVALIPITAVFSTCFRLQEYHPPAYRIEQVQPVRMAPQTLRMQPYRPTPPHLRPGAVESFSPY